MAILKVLPLVRVEPIRVIEDCVGAACTSLNIPFNFYYQYINDVQKSLKEKSLMPDSAEEKLPLWWLYHPFDQVEYMVTSWEIKCDIGIYVQSDSAWQQDERLTKSYEQKLNLYYEEFIRQLKADRRVFRINKDKTQVTKIFYTGDGPYVVDTLQIRGLNLFIYKNC